MGIFYIGCKVENHKDGRSVLVPKLLVDTGSEYTWIDAHLLEKLGIERRKKDIQIRMANGQIITRSVGYAVLRVNQAETIDEVVFAEPGDLLLLGCRALEGLNLRVDSRAKKLVAAGPVIAAVSARIIEKHLIDAPATPQDCLQAIKDLLYCLQQSLAFFRYKYEGLSDAERASIPLALTAKGFRGVDLTSHNAALESTLLNIRALGEFFKCKNASSNRKADIRYFDIFGNEPQPLFTEDEERQISQIFVHITANRNIRRNPKKGWPLASLENKVVLAFERMLQSPEFQGRFSQFLNDSTTDEYSVIQHIRNLLDAATQLIKKEETGISQNEHMVMFNRSGTNEFEYFQ